jgi:hypothetical protein
VFFHTFNGGVITKEEDLENFILNYFKGIFCEQNHCNNNQMIQSCISRLVSQEDNSLLVRIPTDIEIIEVVFSLNGDGAPGPDGFSGYFYQHFWDIVAFDVIYPVQSFFLTGKLPFT